MMDVDLYIGLKGARYCKNVCFGVIDDCLLEEITNASTRRTINLMDDESDCEFIPVKLPLIVCPPDVTIQPPFEFEIGNPINFGEVLHGIYLFDSAKSPAPDAAQLAADIIANPNNYTTSPFSPQQTLIDIDASNEMFVFYHVFRVTAGLTLTIEDAGNVDVTSGFVIQNDSSHTYYYSAVSIAPSRVAYTLSS